jgi:hypothetical protein
MARNESDVFICKLSNGEYWAYPSPFVAHGAGTEIHFRNLTEDAVGIDLGDAPVHRKMLSLKSGAADYVVVNGDAKPGLYEYEATVETAAATRSSRTGAAKAATSSRPRRIKVKSHSSPKIIIDT